MWGTRRPSRRGSGFTNKPASRVTAARAGETTLALGHEVNARGNSGRPDLSGVGRFSAEARRQKILDPNAGTAAPQARGCRRLPNVVVVKTKAGQEIHGTWRNEDSYSLRLTDAAGALQRLDKSTLVEISLETQSLMPADYGKRLSDSEIQNLVAYLKTPNGCD